MKRPKAQSGGQLAAPAPANERQRDAEVIIEATRARLDDPRLSWGLGLKPGVELPRLKRKIAEVVYQLLDIDRSLRDDLADRRRHARYVRRLERLDFLAEENPTLSKAVREELELQKIKARGFKAHHGSERSWRKYIYGAVLLSLYAVFQHLTTARRAKILDQIVTIFEVLEVPGAGEDGAPWAIARRFDRANEKQTRPGVPTPCEYWREHWFCIDGRFPKELISPGLCRSSGPVPVSIFPSPIARYLRKKASDTRET